MKTNLFILISIFIPFFAFSQGIRNNAAKIVITNGGYIYVDNQGGYLNEGAGEIDNEGTIKLTGDWTNNGSTSVFTNINSTGDVQFIGTSALQEIGGSAGTTFENLTVNNSAGGVYITQDIKVGYNLTLNQGDFDLRDNDVELLSSGQVVNEDATHRLKSTDGSNDGQGSGEIYTYRTNPSGNVANLGLTLVDQISGTNLKIARGHHVQNGTGSYSGNQSVFRYYKIENPGASNYVGKNLRWETIYNPELNGHNANELIMYQWTQESWNGTPGPQFWSPLPDNNSGSSVPITQSLRSSILDYVFVTLGSESMPLPVELTDYKTECQQNGSIRLIWHTASEISNDYFTVLRSYDAVHFEPITTISGAGQSNQLLEYEYVDFPDHTPAYYKLTQTDYNGKTTKLGLQSATCFGEYNETANFDFNILGNDNQNISIELNGKVQTTYLLKVFDATGKIILQKQIYQNQPIERKTINIGNNPSAMYIVSLTDVETGQNKTKKIVVAK